MQLTTQKILQGHNKKWRNDENRGVHIVVSYAFPAAKTTGQQTSILPQTFSLARDRHLLVRVPEHIFGLLLEQLLAEQLHLEETIL